MVLASEIRRFKHCKTGIAVIRFDVSNVYVAF